MPSFFSRVQSSQGDTRNYDLTNRRTLATCQLRLSVEAAIVNIDKEVQMLRKRQENLELKVDEILNLLRKPQSGKIVVVVLLCFESNVKDTTAQRRIT